MTLRSPILDDDAIAAWASSPEYQAVYASPIPLASAASPEALRDWVHATGPSPIQILIEQSRDQSLRPDTRQRAAIAACAYLYGRPESKIKADVSQALGAPKIPTGRLSDDELASLEALLAKAVGDEGPPA